MTDRVIRSLSVTKDMDDLIDEQAKKRGQSVSAYIRELVIKDIESKAWAAAHAPQVQRWVFTK